MEARVKWLYSLSYPSSAYGKVVMKPGWLSDVECWALDVKEYRTRGGDGKVGEWPALLSCTLYTNF